MKYYIDCEFDGLGGQLLSVGIVSETGKSLYVAMDFKAIQDDWVRENVLPILYDVPVESIDFCCFGASEDKLSQLLQSYFLSDVYVHVIADWPDDIKYFCAAVITGPGTMINVPGIKLSVKRVDAYPSPLEAIPGFKRHNAFWDAAALREHMAMAERAKLEAV